MNPIWGFAIVVGILGWALSRRSSASETPSAPVAPPGLPFPKDLGPLDAPSLPAPPPLEDVGDPSEPLPSSIDDETKKDIDTLVNHDKVSLPKILKSPFAGISDEAWTRYVQTQKGGKLNTVSSTNNLGLFHLGMRLLQDLGYATNVKLLPFPEAGPNKQAYQGDFSPPLTKADFLSNAKLQYEAFRRMSENHAKVLVKEFGHIFAGKVPLEGQVPTLSGFLAVAKRAGMGGLRKWFEGDRKPETTAEYKKANNIF